MKPSLHPKASAGRRQRGVVLIYALITLVILLIGAVAISRSISGSQFSIGNIGFKRDMTNQGERALLAAMNAVSNAGALNSPESRQTNQPAANYSASMLATDAHGIPMALLSDGAFNAVGQANNDISDSGLTIRYVVDRLGAAGPCSDSTCALTGALPVRGGAALPGDNLPPPQQEIFRVTVRVTGPRNTLSFFQSTFTTN